MLLRCFLESELFSSSFSVVFSLQVLTIHPKDNLPKGLCDSCQDALSNTFNNAKKIYCLQLLLKERFTKNHQVTVENKQACQVFIFFSFAQATSNSTFVTPGVSASQRLSSTVHQGEDQQHQQQVQLLLVNGSGAVDQANQTGNSVVRLPTVPNAPAGHAIGGGNGITNPGADVYFVSVC